MAAATGLFSEKHQPDVWRQRRKVERDTSLTARCKWKHCSVFLRICWKLLRAIRPKQKVEILKWYGLKTL